jgi:hypothetical protein
MHYPQCNGRGDWSLVLTPRDKNGVACVYGPSPTFTLDPTLVNNVSKCAVSSNQQNNGTPKTDSFPAQTVAKGSTKPYGPFASKPGTPMEVKIGGPTASGDPDLYVKFADRPTVSAYDCRPYTSGATETCALTVPATATQFFVMVRGYEAGKYDLTVTHTP